MNMDNKHEQIWESLRDHEFRKQFIDEHITVGIAFQIRSLRNRQTLTQTNLAERMGVKQPLVSSWENPDYGKYSLGTLKELAKAFDVGLLVRFVPFSKLLDWTIDLTPDIIAPPSFGEEEKYHIMSPALVIPGTKTTEDTKDTDPYDLSHLFPKQMPSTASTTSTTREFAYA